jgi:Signal transduction histidine kinase
MLANVRGRPPIRAAAKIEGFGSKLVRQSVAAQLGGAVAFDWSEEEAVATSRMSTKRIAE